MLHVYVRVCVAVQPQAKRAFFQQAVLNNLQILVSSPGGPAKSMAAIVIPCSGTADCYNTRRKSDWVTPCSVCGRLGRHSKRPDQYCALCFAQWWTACCYEPCHGTLCEQLRAAAVRLPQCIRPELCALIAHAGL